jgi:hypothetical protein
MLPGNSAIQNGVPEIDKFYDEVKTSGAVITEGIIKRVYGGR